MWRNEKIQTGKTLISPIYAVQSLQWLFILVAPQSISRTSFNYGKTGFCISGTLDWNGSSTFQRKISTRKHGSVFSLKIKGAIDAAENKSWVVVTKLSNKLFLSFSNLSSALLILGIALYTYMKFGEAVSELAKIVGLSFFGYSKLNI